MRALDFLCHFMLFIRINHLLGRIILVVADLCRVHLASAVRKDTQHALFMEDTRIDEYEDRRQHERCQQVARRDVEYTKQGDAPKHLVLEDLLLRLAMSMAI